MPNDDGYRTTPEERLLISLDHFKDWSNYLLVTSIAVAAWLATNKIPDINEAAHLVSLGLLVASAGYGILTLSFVPLIAQQMKPSDISIYNVEVRYNRLPFATGEERAPSSTRAPKGRGRSSSTPTI